MKTSPTPTCSNEASATVLPPFMPRTSTRYQLAMGFDFTSNATLLPQSDRLETLPLYLGRITTTFTQSALPLIHINTRRTTHENASFIRSASLEDLIVQRRGQGQRGDATSAVERRPSDKKIEVKMASFMDSLPSDQNASASATRRKVLHQQARSRSRDPFPAASVTRPHARPQLAALCKCAPNAPTARHYPALHARYESARARASSLTDRDQA